MPSDSTTIIKCFNSKLPDLGVSPNIKYTSVSSSSATTKNAKPAKVYIYEPADLLVERADEFLSKTEVSGGHINEAQTFEAYPEIKLSNEAGVVAGSWGYIILPLIAALRLSYPDQFEVGIEDNHIEAYVDEAGIQKTIVRSDLVFRRLATNARPGKIIAIIEYKRREVIRYRDYDKAIRPSTTTRAQANKETATMKPEDTKLIGNAMTHGKQVCTYAAIAECKHVALFNWDHLLLFKFYLLEPDMKKTAGPHANITWVTEGGPLQGMMEDRYIRKVLLGWLLMAFKDAFD